MANVLKANIHYLKKLKELFCGNKISSLDYKLVRKELFVSTANLSAALHRMLSEPKNKQSHRKEIYEFVVLNHVLSSNVASLTAVMIHKENAFKEFINPVKSSINILEESLHRLDKNYLEENNLVSGNTFFIANKTTDLQLKEQLDFIYKVSTDIGKITSTISK